jgi:hypothetical protein
MTRNDTGLPGIDEHFDGVARMELAERRDDRMRPLIVAADGMTRGALSRGDGPAFLKHG